MGDTLYNFKFSALDDVAFGEPDDGTLFRWNADSGKMEPTGVKVNTSDATGLHIPYGDFIYFEQGGSPDAAIGTDTAGGVALFDEGGYKLTWNLWDDNGLRMQDGGGIASTTWNIGGNGSFSFDDDHINSDGSGGFRINGTGDISFQPTGPAIISMASGNNSLSMGPDGGGMLLENDGIDYTYAATGGGVSFYGDGSLSLVGATAGLDVQNTGGGGELAFGDTGLYVATNNVNINTGNDGSASFGGELDAGSIICQNTLQVGGGSSEWLIIDPNAHEIQLQTGSFTVTGGGVSFDNDNINSTGEGDLSVAGELYAVGGNLQIAPDFDHGSAPRISTDYWSIGGDGHVTFSNLHELTADGYAMHPCLLLGSAAGPLGGTDTASNDLILIGYNTGAGANNSDSVAATSVMIGNMAGNANRYGYHNVFIGQNAAQSNVGDSGDSLRGSGNTVIGALSGQNNTTGAHNTFVGDHAGQGLTTGDNNVMIGAETAEASSTAYNSTFVGEAAGKKVTTGDSNVLIGFAAGFNLTTGTKNAVIGGVSAANGLTTGSFNVIIGTQNAGYALTTGSNNTIINASCYTLTTGSGNLIIGTQANNLDVEAAGTSNTINIADAIVGTIAPGTPSLKIVGLFITTSNSTATATFNAIGRHETIYDASPSTIASLTINLPTVTIVGQIVRYVTKAIATTVTVTGTVSIGAALTTLAANGSVAWQAVDTGGTFIRLQ